MHINKEFEGIVKQQYLEMKKKGAKEERSKFELYPNFTLFINREPDTIEMEFSFEDPNNSTIKDIVYLGKFSEEMS